ncbi:MAG: OmpA family protein [Nevskia sp.]|nr:OmpA family protein [Nevskia sp.]
MRKLFRGGVCAAALLWANQAAAVHVDDYRIPYVTSTFNYEISDGVRHSGNGLGFQFGAGVPLGEQSALELSVYDLARRRDADGGTDRQLGVFPNFVYDFGLWGFDESYLPNFKPFVLGGPGFINESVLGGHHSVLGVDGGAGVLIPLHVGKWNWGWSVRTEVDAVASFSHGAVVPGESALVDYHLMLGLQIPLTPLFQHRHPPAQQPDCAVAVVDPVTGRRDCVVDTDGDGVPDSRDQCPGTPPGTKVDAVGCPVAVEPPKDTDGDGVVDNSDKCPDTPKGAKVDASGCAIPQLLGLPVIRFASDSASLPPGAAHDLDEMAISLEGQPAIRLVLEGHADTSGGENHNRDLSRRRADAVRQYLIWKGIDPARLTAQGFNGLRPIASNDHPEGRAQNRRVEFRLVGQ